LQQAIGYIMEKVHLVLVGAYGVVESGGIINQLGTSTMAIVANALNKPFYVAVETHKFVRIFPISQVCK
jgi:translation initiation factor eIF-2B subunit alpha